MDLWLKIILGELGFKQDGPMVIYTDRDSAIKLARNPVYHEGTKHVEVNCHFNREKKIQTEDVMLSYISTNDQVADFLTKAIS